MKLTMRNKVGFLIVMLVIAGIVVLAFFNDKIEKSALGSFDNPELAFKETQKALNVLSANINLGMKSVKYVEEYELAKNKIFIEE